MTGSSSTISNKTLIYIAAPHDNYNVLLSLKKTIQSDKDLSNVIFLTGADSFNFLEKASANCSVFRSHLYDSHSLLEQEICFNSDKFLWSTGSSWSLNVLQERSLSGRGGSDVKNLKELFGFKGGSRNLNENDENDKNDDVNMLTHAITSARPLENSQKIGNPYIDLISKSTPKPTHQPTSSVLQPGTKYSYDDRK